MKKPTLLLILGLLFCINFFYAQDNDALFKNDTTRIKIFNKKPYRLIQHYKKLNGKLISKFTYKEVDLSNVNFKTSLTTLLKSSYNTLDLLAIILNDNPTINLQINGFTDKVGDTNKNLKLSIKRARAIKLYLQKKGINEKRLVANGYGDTKLICDTPCKENQRVEFLLEQGDILPHCLSFVRENNPDITDEEVKKLAQEMKNRILKREKNLKPD